MSRISLGSLVGRISNESIAKTRALFIAALLTTFVLEILASMLSDNGLKFLLLNTTIGGAAVFSGALLGFVFGVPRVASDQVGGGPDNQESHATTGSERKKFRANTNLEQISDWLTKILVGAGLTSLSGLPDFAKRTIVFLDSGAYRDVIGGGTLAVFLVIYFGALGFLWCYIETRTTFTELLDPNSA